MNYTVIVNEKKKEIRVMLDGYEGVAKCCPTDNFNLGTGIELALERAKVAKANAEKPKVEAKPDMSVSEAIKVLEKYAGGHIIVIGGGENISESQKAELRRYADIYAPTPHKCSCDCCSHSEAYDEGYNEGYEDGYDEGFEKGEAITRDELEDEYCECGSEDKQVEALAKAITKLLNKVMLD